MRDCMHKIAAVGVVASVALLCGQEGALGAPRMRQTAQLGFTSERPGSPTGTNWLLQFRDPANPNGKPHALQSTIAEFPPGSTIDTTAPAQCHAPDADLTANGTAACPSESRVATGKLDVDTGSLAIFPRVLHN